MVKEGLKRRIIDIERERRRAQGVGDRKTLVKGPGTDQVSHWKKTTIDIAIDYYRKVYRCLNGLYFKFHRYQHRECQLAISLVDMNMRHLWILSTITKNHVVSDLVILDAPSSKQERPSEILNQGSWYIISRWKSHEISNNNWTQEI